MLKKIILVLTSTSILLLAGCASEPRSSTISTNAGSHVALLVPLSGPLAPYGNAIRNGFFTAYYDGKSQNSNGSTIAVIDANAQSIEAGYQQAVSQGANLVVGPLDKTQVTALANMHLNVPVLALNRSTNSANNDALVEFALSPTDEAEQAAVKAASDNHHAVLILAPQSPYGTRLVNAFRTQWQKTGGTVVATQYYNDISTLSKNISDVLQINQGRNDAKALQHMLHQEVRYMPQRRQDFDSIFMIATPAFAKQIQLLLHFYFVNNVPTYAMSQVYNGVPSEDLDGIMFCDMPWLLAPNQMSASLQSLQQHIQSLWPNNYNSLAKFYAMGVDAYYLMPNLSAMSQNPNIRITGATGILSVSPQHQIVRQLMWAQIRNGVPSVM